MNSDLKKIKKHYGEAMMHLCRKLFPTILEEDGRLFELMQANFYDNKFLYDDLVRYGLIIEFKDFIYDKYYGNDEEKEHTKVLKSPDVLLREAGYTLYECKTEEDIQKFRKYYAPDEELCTFDGHRLDSCFVFFAVKNNALDLRREDFSNPDRQDEYGTSVISIQYHRGNRNTLSIKNRYNHTVDNPDATFGNDLDNIILGLNASFEETYGFHETGSANSFNIMRANYVKANDGKYYRYNYEIDTCYYCPGNIIIDNYEVIDKYHFDKEKYIIMDYFMIDLVDKKISTLFIKDDYIANLNHIKKIEIIRNKDNGNKTITLFMDNDKRVIFEINEFNQIIKLYDEYTEKIPSDSLYYVKYLRELSMPNVRICGDNFLRHNVLLEKIDMLNVEYVGDCFLASSRILPAVNFLKLKNIGDYFMRSNDMMQELSLPSAEIIGDDFMALNRSLLIINLPNVRIIGSWFLSSNNRITGIDMPKLESVLSNFLSNDYHLEYANCPNLTLVRNNFLERCIIKSICFPKLCDVGDFFMRYNSVAQVIDLPSVEDYGISFLEANDKIDLSNFFENYHNKLVRKKQKTF